MQRILPSVCTGLPFFQNDTFIYRLQDVAEIFPYFVITGGGNIRSQDFLTDDNIEFIPILFDGTSELSQIALDIRVFGQRQHGVIFGQCQIKSGRCHGKAVEAHGGD